MSLETIQLNSGHCKTKNRVFPFEKHRNKGLKYGFRDTFNFHLLCRNAIETSLDKEENNKSHARVFDILKLTNHDSDRLSFPLSLSSRIVHDVIRKKYILNLLLH